MSIHRTLKNLLIILVSVAFFLLFQFLLLFLKKELKDLHIYFSSSNINVLSVIVQSLNQLSEPQPFMVLFFSFLFFSDLRATDFTLSKICETTTKIWSHLSTVIFTPKRFVRVESCGYFVSLHIYLSFSIITYALSFISSPVS